MKKTVLALLISLFFVACGDKAPSSATSITADGRIDVKDVALMLPVDSGQLVKSDLLDGSTIRVVQAHSDSILALYQYTNKMAAIDLSAIEDSLQTVDVAQFFGQVISNCTVSNNQAKIGAVILIAYNAAGRRIGDLTLTDLTQQKSAAAASFAMISQIYATQSTTITGKWEEQGLALELNLNLVKGWNNFVSTTSIDEQTKNAKITFSSVYPSVENLRWEIRPTMNLNPASN